jgi:hypothetical protein
MKRGEREKKHYRLASTVLRKIANKKSAQVLFSK